MQTKINYLCPVAINHRVISRSNYFKVYNIILIFLIFFFVILVMFGISSSSSSNLSCIFSLSPSLFIYNIYYNKKKSKYCIILNE